MRLPFSIIGTAERAALAIVLFLLAAPGCTDQEGLPTGGSGAASGSGGSGGATGGGGAGGAACLPASAYESLFTLEAPDLCALGVYTAAGTISYQQPTWGAHGGPLLVAAGANDGEVTLSRWKAPAGAEGAMTIADTTVGAGVPAGAFVGGAAIDLGFRPGTLVSYAGAFPDTQGELIVIDGAKSDERYPVNALFSMALLPEAQGGRLVYSGFSTLGDAAAAPNGLYAADDCAGTFDPAAAAGCAAPLAVAAWGDSSGPVAADAQGNVFAVMTSFSGDQEGRAFAASAVAKGAAATDGDVLFSLPGFGVSLAALAPADGAPGIVAFQPSDPMTFEALDVLQIRYAADGGAVTAEGAPSALLTLATANTPVAMLTDPEDRLWVGVPEGAGTTFVVLGRKPD